MKSSRRHVRVLAVAATIAIVVAACGGFNPDPEVIARGERLYAASCVRCHGGPTGGQISDIPPRHNAQGHTWHHGDCLLADIVLDGLPPRQGATGNEVMPAFRGKLTDAEIEAILTYVTTWWTDEQRASQAQVTATQCAAG
ncbi:MAG: cytochrome c [Nitriliruptoraceae bacterium]